MSPFFARLLVATVGGMFITSALLVGAAGVTLVVLAADIEQWD